MHNVISLSDHRTSRATVLGAPLTVREVILATIERNGRALVAGSNSLGKLTALRLERAGLIRIEEWRRDGSSRVLLPVEMEPKMHEETSIWVLLPRHNITGRVS